jgi:8-oxo-dGTP pyrophosphatase MutT (NUDIX family)
VPGAYYLDPSAPTPNRPRSIGVAALIARDGSLLLDSRVDPPGWGLIAGRLEDDETLAEALVREVAEETGLAVTSYRLFGTFSHPSRIVAYADGNVYSFVTIAYLVDVADTAALRPSDETNELRFFTRDVLPLSETIATHRPIVELWLSGSPPPHLE